MINYCTKCQQYWIETIDAFHFYKTKPLLSGEITYETCPICNRKIRNYQNTIVSGGQSA